MTPHSYCITCQLGLEENIFDNSHLGHNIVYFPKCPACDGTGKAEDAMRRKVQGLWYAN